jgi:hypothetical protein
MTEFADALIAAYRENPPEVLPYPLWVALPELARFQTAHTAGPHGVERLEAWDDASLYIYWRRTERHPSLLIRRRLAYVRVTMIHQDFLDPDTVAGFTTRRPYFRLIHRTGAPIPAVDLPAGLDFAPIDPAEDAAAIADLIARCAIEDEDVPDTGAIQAWAERPVYAPDLWLWVIDTTSGERVGLAIGEYDPVHDEAMLGPARLLPGYPEDAARALTVELLRRTSARSPFTTLTAPLPFPERLDPGALYQTCGFSDAAVWWLLAREDDG